MAKKQQEYGNDSIRQLKGADRVRKRPAVIFGSDGVEGCAHSIFEIISNSIDEARDGHGNRINVTLYPDHVVEVEDFGRGIPVDYNKAEDRWNWDLVFCELYAGGKYAEGSGNYDFSLGLNGLGLCATQYASEWMTADIYRDGFHYHLDFKKGENVGGLQKEPFKGKRTGSVIRWKPDTEVFTDIAVPADSFKDMLRRQAVVNDGVTLVFEDKSGGDTEKYEYLYEHGITDYVNELVGDKGLTPVHFCSGSATGRDRADQPDYQVKMNVAFAFSNTVQRAQLVHLAHRLGAEDAVPVARLIAGFYGALHRVQRLFQRFFAALLAAGAGVEDDPLTAQRLDQCAALQQIVDAVQPLVLLEAGHADIVGRVHREGDAPRGAGFAQSVCLVVGQPHAAAALVFKGGQAKTGGVGGDGGGVKLFDGVAVRQAGRAKTRLIHAQSLPFYSIGPASKVHTCV